MPSRSGAYELLDFGEGRKLERFGRRVVDRPCPTAEGIPRVVSRAWSQAIACYEEADDGRMQWAVLEPHASDPLPWLYEQDRPFRIQLGLDLLPSGQVGVFPEQADNWAWIHESLNSSAVKPLRVLNLFAYTGASTIAAAAAGAEVAHVDAARPAVDRAAANAAASGLADAPIRWIVEDALKFARREVRRGKRYEAVILDPPTYGHGPKGEVWQIQRDLPHLLAACSELTASGPSLVLATAHTTGLHAQAFRRQVGEAFSIPLHHVERGELTLRTADGRTLPSGVFARYSRSGVPA